MPPTGIYFISDIVHRDQRGRSKMAMLSQKIDSGSSQTNQHRKERDP
jgi:hypothetical protein